MHQKEGWTFTRSQQYTTFLWVDQEKKTKNKKKYVPELNDVPAKRQNHHRPLIATRLSWIGPLKATAEAKWWGHSPDAGFTDCC